MSERRVPRGPWARGCCGDRPIYAVGSGAAGAIERGQGVLAPGTPAAGTVAPPVERVGALLPGDAGCRGG